MPRWWLMARLSHLGPRADVEALRRSTRVKLMGLLALLLAAVVAAWLSFSRDGGTGNPEDPTKVLVVSRGEILGYSVVLREGGFSAVEGTYEVWQKKAKSEVPGPR